ncbi:hypothetical protein RRG08_055425 [Elysia crispata]|uniref:Transposase n=1 Tax=Elysia crispata TaxID=231223 RepID=A0AAE1E447_9GAST|nr:hypothetical protein RRG08_055425 [Elysia crispata]
MIIKSKLVTDCLDPVLVKFNDHFQIVRFVPKILEIWNFTIPEPNAILYWCSKVCKAGDRSSSEITRGEGSYCSDEASWKSTGNLDQWMRGKWQLVGGAITKLRSQCNMFRWAPKPLFAADYTSGAAIDPLFTCTSRELTCSQFLEMFHTVRKWVKAVSEGRDDMEDEPRPGRPVTACGDANISKVLVSLSDDRRKTCEEISTETSMSRTSVFKVLTNKLNKKKKFSKWVPRLLTDEQKESRVNFSRNFLRRFQTEQNDFLGRIITGDETWVYSWDPETKRQSAEWRDFDEPRPEKVRRKKGLSRSCT